LLALPAIAGRPAIRLAWNNVDLDPALEPVTLLSFERPPSAAVLLVGDRAHAHLENSIAAVKRVLSNQENKGTRWMPWRQEPMKDVGGCDKPREGADHPLIRGFPNGETYAW
jgi:hypothetical protein